MHLRNEDIGKVDEPFVEEKSHVLSLCSQKNAIENLLLSFVAMLCCLHCHVFNNLLEKLVLLASSRKT
jgi:hypothetical protein